MSSNTNFLLNAFVLFLYISAIFDRGNRAQWFTVSRKFRL